MTVHEISKLELALAGMPGFNRVIFPLCKKIYDEFILRGQILNPRGPEQWARFMDQYSRRRRFDILEATTFSGFGQIAGGYMVSVNYQSPWGWLFIIWGLVCAYVGTELKSEESEDKINEQFIEQKKEIEKLKEQLDKLTK